MLDKTKKTHKIRLNQIDTLEKSQAFGQRSKQYLSNLVYQQLVQVQWDKEDRYGRKLGTVYVSSKNINYLMVIGGLA